MYVFRVQESRCWRVTPYPLTENTLTHGEDR